MLKFGMPILAAFALILSFFSVQRMAPNVVRAEPPFAPPKTSFPNQIGAVGLVESATENIGVSLPVSGLVTQVAVQAGASVHKGQLLFSLDDRDLQAELSLRQTSVSLSRSRLDKLKASPRPEELPPAQARIDEAKAQLEDANVQLRMIEAVKDQRAIRQEDLLRRRRAVETSQARLDQAEANLRLLKAGTWQPDLDVAIAELRQAEAQVQRIEADISRLQVRAPIDGKILQCKVRLGEFAQSGTLAQPLILMGQVNQLHVRADIDEKDAWRFQHGAKATGSVRGNSASVLPLQFVRIEPYVIPKRNLSGDATERVDTRVLQVLYKLPAEAAIYPGQQMDLSIEAARGAR